MELVEVNKPSVVFHLAARTIVNDALKSPLDTFDTNVNGTLTILETCRLTDSIESIVVASSDKAYGEPLYVPIREDHPLAPQFPYDTSKAVADLISRSYARTYGLPIVVTRSSNIYGPNDRNFSRVVPSTVRDVFLGKRPEIRSDGRPVRDYIYVDDVVEAYLLLAENAKRFKGHAFNIGTSKPTTVLDLVSAVLSASNSQLKPKILNLDTSQIRRQYLDVGKIRKLVGWQPKTSLEEGIAKTVLWYKQNEAVIPK
ncbi:MAG: GDP-mannose 4,6-dehydratase [Nitrososphaerota archaeon]|nr:GDP-mannose 4,6-dehydratase [Nitrososphaerota archaeon]